MGSITRVTWAIRVIPLPSKAGILRLGIKAGMQARPNHLRTFMLKRASAGKGCWLREESLWMACRQRNLADFGHDDAWVRFSLRPLQPTSCPSDNLATGSNRHSGLLVLTLTDAQMVDAAEPGRHNRSHAAADRQLAWQPIAACLLDVGHNPHAASFPGRQLRHCDAER